MRLLMLLVLLVAVGVGVAVALQNVNTPLRTASPPAAPAKSPANPDRVFAAGTVEGVGRDVDLRFELVGRLEILGAAVGQKVRKGEVVARIDPSIWERELAEAEASLKLAQSEKALLENAARRETREVARSKVRLAEVRLGHASKEKLRGENLMAKRALAEEEMDRLRFDFDLADAELNVAKLQRDEIEAPARADELEVANAKIRLAQARVEKAKTAVAKTVLTSPSDGTILHVYVEAGELVGPADATPILTMTDTREARVRAFVEELDAHAVVPGQRAIVKVDGLSEEFAGTVLSCAPYMVPKNLLRQTPGERIDVKVREAIVRLESGSRLVIGTPVDVFIDRTGPATESQ